MVKEIPLTQGKVALVDDEDYDWLMQWKWHAVKVKRKGIIRYWYASRRRSVKEELKGCPNRRLDMHRAIMGDALVVDHHNGDGLDNRRSNLRAADFVTNGRNRRKQINKTSSVYKGVSWNKRVQKWRVTVTQKHQKGYFGAYANEVTAARVYDEIVSEHFGEFANTNFPLEKENTVVPFRPLLAAKAEDAVLRFPLLASPKLDGIRATVIDGVPMSRTLKPIPNTFVRACFAEHAGLLEGLDGELIVGEPTHPAVYRKTASGMMSEDGEPDFTYQVFDFVDSNAPFTERLAKAREICDRGPAWVQFVAHAEISSEEDLLSYESAVLAIGFEGVMLRDPNGPYKQGRSTAKEGVLLKLKRFSDAEALIVGFEPKMRNENTAVLDERGYTKRSTHQDNKVALDTLGNLLVKGLNGGFENVGFSIGTGFDDAERQRIWRLRHTLVGKIVKYKYFAVGVKDAPRHPVFLGFREKIDMAA